MSNEYDEEENVFTDDKVPALSFKDAAKGQKVVLKVTRPAKLVQRKDFNTGEPAVYKDTGKPMMAGVFSGEVLEASDMWTKSAEDDEMDDANPVGEERSFWAGRPSQPFRELINITGKAGLNRALRAGDVLSITLKDLVLPKNSKMAKPKKQKIYEFEVLEEGAAPSVNAFAPVDDDEEDLND